MKTIYLGIYGSRLYGTQLPDSDFDYKGVYLESPDEAVFRHDENCQGEETIEGVKTEKQLFSAKRFSELIFQGQTIALEMLFTPKDKWVFHTKEWEALQEHRAAFVSQQLAPFVGYAKAQAYKYGAKGNTLFAAQELLRHVKDLATSPMSNDERFGEIVRRITIQGIEEITITESPTDRGESALVIGGKMFCENTALGYWLDPLERLIKGYGARSQAAAQADGADRKAQYHAYRIGCEALELLETGKLTFPRPEVDTLMQIRAGEIPQDQLEEMFTGVLSNVNAALLESKLPEKPDALALKRWVRMSQLAHFAESLKDPMTLALIHG